MADLSEQEFLEKYGRFLVTSWGTPPVKKRFKEDPAKVLKEFGLDPGNAQVLVEKPGPPSAQATKESAAKLWNDGKKAGKIRFIYPEEPPADLATMDLTDDQLEAIAGGGYYCCCCTPCCSC
jgi:hypothetical protein